MRHEVLQPSTAKDINDLVQRVPLLFRLLFN